jgi:hypothetical protein
MEHLQLRLPKHASGFDAAFILDEQNVIYISPRVIIAFAIILYLIT